MPRPEEDPGGEAQPRRPPRGRGAGPAAAARRGQTATRRRKVEDVARPEGDGDRVAPPRTGARRGIDGSTAGASRAASARDPLRGPEDSPWVRYERLREEVRSAPGRARPQLPDLSALLIALEGLRMLVPRELSVQLTALVRELLLTLRALIDWYLERLDGGPHEPEVEDIPLD